MAEHPDIEKMARAIIRRRAVRGDALGPELTGADLDRYVDQAWRYWIDDARAAWACALDCMTEPSEAMKKASSRGDARRATFYWKRMLEAKRGELGLT